MMWRIGSWTLVLLWAIFLVHCPILKPWFGFRKPQGHTGKWFQ